MVTRMIGILMLGFALSGCNAVLATLAIFDALAPGAQEECEAKGGRWYEEKRYDSRTGKLVREDEWCTIGHPRGLPK